ncbi:membrane hypothetical protein [Candidatus Nitrotoga sp. BS]|uniref:sulfatase-like hydrolase/transferase n=1 Tax=Candidatus Nitrotoga sp. BS TaxID=2890408 RepID=UPI001EF23F6B|nr:sulfatase-like hydrolase/transferase [Candidatus Nitrotoga sp. BS]CAH1202367.1 membrane hypothetical protein [Candidatus Nitrotoga sp. BS]
MIYQYALAPIEAILESVFVILIGVSNSYFLSLVLLAILVRLVTKPLEKYASRAVTTQAEIESVLAPQINAIKHIYIGVQRHEAMKRLYARYAYSPVYAIRSLAGLGVQLPFFIAAYFMLSGYSQLNGIVIPVLGDLGKPDTLLFGKAHLMPFVMTLVNVLALVTAPGFSRKSLIQGLVISLMFLALLYASPLALLIYWTTSNLFSLISNLVPAISGKLNLRKPKGQFKNTFVGRSFEEYAYLFFVTNLAILVPLLGVLGDQFNFFTAHSLSSKSIITLLLTISLAPPLILTILRWASKRVGMVKVFDGAVLFAFLGLFLFYSLNKAGYGFFPAKYEPYILFFLTLVITTAAVLIIIKNQLMRTLSYLSLIIFLVFLNFIFVSPASTLFKHSENISSSKIAGMNDTPVFLLIFDEFSGLTLQNVKGKLDTSRYPGFAELAAQADYFPNALTAHYATDISVPSIASGNLRVQDKKGLGLAPGKNLIELFQSTGSVYAQSTVLPADLMSKQNTNPSLFISDFITLYVHIISHQDWIEEKIGAIPQTWKGFGIFFKKEEHQLDKKILNPHVQQFVDWLEEVNNSEVSNQFNFVHSQFPHVDVNAHTTVLGRQLKNEVSMLQELLKPRSENFNADQSPLNVAYHNYMQQSAYTDRLLQDFIRILKKKNLYDKSLIVITSDHGVSYNKKGFNRRYLINEDSWKNIISVPLFIKYPYQKEGNVNSSFVTTLDISTTIINVIGLDSPWESVGQNLKGIKNNSQTRSVELIPGYEEYFHNIKSLFQSVRIRKKHLFGEESPVHTIAVNFTEDPTYATLPRINIADLIVGPPSDLHYSFSEKSLITKEISYFGTIYQESRPVNNKVIAIVVGGAIQAVTKSGKAGDQDGFFAFSLPEKEAMPTNFNMSLYEIEGQEPFRFREIETTTLQKVLKHQFSESKQRLSYDWKKSVLENYGFEALRIDINGIEALSSENKDSFIDFKGISQNTIAEPILHIRLESDREQLISFYYQTTHKPKFDESQRLVNRLIKGTNSIYIKIPEKDFVGPFRINTDRRGANTIIIKDIEIRH